MRYGITLERAEYVNADHTKRAVVEFDWTRAANNEPAWRVRAYERRPHAERGETWKMKRRRYHRRDLGDALRELAPWMRGERETVGRG